MVEGGAFSHKIGYDVIFKEFLNLEGEQKAGSLQLQDWIGSGPVKWRKKTELQEVHNLYTVRQLFYICQSCIFPNRIFTSENNSHNACVFVFSC